MKSARVGKAEMCGTLSLNSVFLKAISIAAMLRRLNSYTLAIVQISQFSATFFVYITY